MADKAIIYVQVPFTEKEYLMLRNESYMTRGGTTGNAVRRRLWLPEQPSGHKVSHALSERQYLSEEG